MGLGSSSFGALWPSISVGEENNNNNKRPFRSGMYRSKLYPSGSPVPFLPGHMKKQRANYMIVIT